MRAYSSANVGRQVSLAGGNGSSQMIWSEGTRDALLPASPVPERRVTVDFERTTGRPAISCTALFALFDLLGQMSRGMSLASGSASGGGWNAQGWESTTSYQAEAPDIASAVASGSAVQIIGRSNLVLWICLLAWLRGPGRHRITQFPLAVGVVSRCTCAGAIYWA
jgi:hypothetical protein